MKKLLVTILCLLPLAMFAQSPFDGTWKAQLHHSKLSSKPYIYSVGSGVYTCETCVPQIAVPADGQDHAVTGQTFDTLSVQIVSSNKIRIVTKKDGKVVTEQDRTASVGGKTLTSVITTHPANGSQPYNTVAKMTRVGKLTIGANGTAGTWRLTWLGKDLPGLTTTWKVSGNEVSMSTPTGESWTATIGGEPAAVKGLSYDESVSVKRLDDRTLELSFRAMARWSAWIR